MNEPEHRANVGNILWWLQFTMPGLWLMAILDGCPSRHDVQAVRVEVHDARTEALDEALDAQTCPTEASP